MIVFGDVMRKVQSFSGTLPMTPLEQYVACVARPGFVDDAGQRDAAVRLTDVAQRLIAQRAAEASAIGRLKMRLRGEDRGPVTGLYLWGGWGVARRF